MVGIFLFTQENKINMKTIKFKLTKGLGEITVNYPNVGQFIELERLKSELSGNSYLKLMVTNTVGSSLALDFIDAIAFLRVMKPTALKMFKNEDILQANVEDLAIYIKSYRSDILPALNSIVETMKDLLSEDTKTQTKEKGEQTMQEDEFEKLNISEFNKNHEDELGATKEDDNLLMSTEEGDEIDEEELRKANLKRAKDLGLQ